MTEAGLQQLDVAPFDHEGDHGSENGVAGQVARLVGGRVKHSPHCLPLNFCAKPERYSLQVKE